MEVPEQFAERFEAITDRNYILQRGDPLLWLSRKNEWVLDEVSSFRGNTVGYIEDSYGDRYVCVKEREVPLTEEEKEKFAKRKAKKFVEKNISNPTKQDYEKFELAFLKNDLIGL